MQASCERASHASIPRKPVGSRKQVSCVTARRKGVRQADREAGFARLATIEL
jgi:hypothetical protein